MTTLFDHTGLPLWVYIVIIAVGSIVLLVTVAVAIRCWIGRRNAKRFQEAEGLTGGPMRRVTVRRGRVVPSSQHLSLTGSKFGMRQFGLLADNESTMTGRRSPFEWWNTIMDRSQSRQDQMSQMETASISTRPASRGTIVAPRPETHGTPSPTPEKNKEPVTRTWELTIPSPSSSPAPSPLGPNRALNFSRSFSNRAPSSPRTLRSQVTLSRISERSPHQSMINTSNSPVLSKPNRTSYQSAINPVDNTPLSGQLSESSLATPRKSMTLAPPPARTRPTTQWPSPSLHDGVPVSNHSKRLSNRRTSHRESPADNSSQLSLPLPVATSMSRSSPQLNLPKLDSQPNHSLYSLPNQSRIELHHSREEPDSQMPAPPLTSQPNRSSSTFDSGVINYDSQIPRSHNANRYWSSRIDLVEASLSSGQRRSITATPQIRHSRNPSTDQLRRSHYSPDEERGEVVHENMLGIVTVPGKNNTKVLRKKSLKRMQIAGSLGA
jgi:hypothetical protein